MRDMRKVSKRSGKIMEDLYTDSGDIFEKLIAQAGKTDKKLYGRKNGLKSLKAKA